LSFSDGLKDVPTWIDNAGTQTAIAVARLPEQIQTRSWYDCGKDLSQSLADGIRATTGTVTDAVRTAARLVDAHDSPHIPSTTAWYRLGKDYMDSLASGLRDRTSVVGTVLGEVHALFPGSAAKWGPFATLPDTQWVADWMSNFGDAFETGVGRLAGLPGLTVEPTLMGGDWGAARPIHIEVNLNDAVIRDERDVRLLAQEIYDQVRRSVAIS